MSAATPVVRGARRPGSRRGWRAYLARTMTGDVGAELDVVSGSLAVTINDIEDITVTASRASLDGVARSWWSPWAGTLVVSYESAFIRETVMGAGPIIDPVAEAPDHSTVTITAKGIGAILDHRTVLDREYQASEVAAMKASTLAWTGVSLGSMVGRIITAATSKRHGSLPIVVPDEEPADRQRTYEGWNLANNGAWKRVREITEVIGGPDVMLRPRWVDDSRTRVEWALVTGTDAQPALPQVGAILWDTTAKNSPVAKISIASDAAALAHRAYATGAGEGAGIAVAIADAVLPEDMPLLEIVVSDTDTENTALLAQKAASVLASQALDQFDLTIHSHGTGIFGTWHVGETATVAVAGWLQVPDGAWPAKVIGASFTLGSDVATVKCQPAVYGQEVSW